jgi:hypothetical protein
MSIQYSAMTSSEIERRLKGNRLTKRIFRGVFAADDIPLKLRLPAGIVVNTDPRDKKGQHWIAIFINKYNQITFFDSYGRPPQIQDHLNFINAQRGHLQYNRRKLQDTATSICGHYCCEFLLSCARGKTLKYFLKPFKNDNSATNDARIILSFYRHFTKMQGGMGHIDNHKGCNQCSCSMRRRDMY